MCFLCFLHPNVPHLKVLTTLSLKHYQLVLERASHVHSLPPPPQCTTPQNTHYSHPKKLSLVRDSASHVQFSTHQPRTACTTTQSHHYSHPKTLSVSS